MKNKKTIIGLVIVLIIIVLLLIIFGNVGRSNDIALNPETMDENTKIGIVTGDITDVSPEIRTQVKKDYLASCEEKSGTEEKINCLEVYYNSKPTLKEKRTCKTITDQKEQDDCMDYYYTTQAHTSSNPAFCESIKDTATQEECFGYIN